MESWTNLNFSIYFFYGVIILKLLNFIFIGKNHFSKEQSFKRLFKYFCGTSFDKTKKCKPKEFYYNYGEDGFSFASLLLNSPFSLMELHVVSLKALEV